MQKSDYKPKGLTRGSAVDCESHMFLGGLWADCSGDVAFHTRTDANNVTTAQTAHRAKGDTPSHADDEA